GKDVCRPAWGAGGDGPKLEEGSARRERGGAAEPGDDDPADDQDEQRGDDRRMPPPLLLNTEPALLGPADKRIELVLTTPAPTPRRRGAHPKTPAARRRSCARIRRSLS